MEELVNLVLATFRMATPLGFAALGGLLSERSGVTNIALEGKILMGAFVGAAIAQAFEGSTGMAPWLGMGGAALAGGVFAALYAFFVLTVRANQIVTATAIIMLASGVPPFVCKLLYDQSGGTPSLALPGRFLHDEPIAILGAVTLLFWLIFRRTTAGLWLRFAGEHPHALESAGISVMRVRWVAVILSGVLAGLGGGTLSLYLSSGFTRDMSAGRGFMALACLIMGKWNPLPTIAACLLFGAASAGEMLLQGVSLFGHTVPVQLINVLPYLLTILVLAGFVGRSRAPSALGQAFSGRR